MSIAQIKSVAMRVWPLLCLLLFISCDNAESVSSVAQSKAVNKGSVDAKSAGTLKLPTWEFHAWQPGADSTCQDSIGTQEDPCWDDESDTMLACTLSDISLDTAMPQSDPTARNSCCSFCEERQGYDSQVLTAGSEDYAAGLCTDGYSWSTRNDVTVPGWRDGTEQQPGLEQANFALSCGIRTDSDNHQYMGVCASTPQLGSCEAPTDFNHSLSCANVFANDPPELMDHQGRPSTSNQCAILRAANVLYQAGGGDTRKQWKTKQGLGQQIAGYCSEKDRFGQAVKVRMVVHSGTYSEQIKLPAWCAGEAGNPIEIVAEHDRDVSGDGVIDFAILDGGVDHQFSAEGDYTQGWKDGWGCRLLDEDSDGKDFNGQKKLTGYSAVCPSVDDLGRLLSPGKKNSKPEEREILTDGDSGIYLGGMGRGAKKAYRSHHVNVRNFHLRNWRHAGIELKYVDSVNATNNKIYSNFYNDSPNMWSLAAGNDPKSPHYDTRFNNKVGYGSLCPDCSHADFQCGLTKDGSPCNPNRLPNSKLEAGDIDGDGGAWSSSDRRLIAGDTSDSDGGIIAVGLCNGTVADNVIWDQIDPLSISHLGDTNGGDGLAGIHIRGPWSNMPITCSSKRSVYKGNTIHDSWTGLKLRGVQGSPGHPIQFLNNKIYNIYNDGIDAKKGIIGPGKAAWYPGKYGEWWQCPAPIYSLPSKKDGPLDIYLPNEEGAQPLIDTNGDFLGDREPIAMDLNGDGIAETAMLLPPDEDMVNAGANPVASMCGTALNFCQAGSEFLDKTYAAHVSYNDNDSRNDVLLPELKPKVSARTAKEWGGSCKNGSFVDAKGVKRCKFQAKDVTAARSDLICRDNGILRDLNFEGNQVWQVSDNAIRLVGLRDSKVIKNDVSQVSDDCFQLRDSVNVLLENNAAYKCRGFVAEATLRKNTQDWNLGRAMDWNADGIVNTADLTAKERPAGVPQWINQNQPMTGTTVRHNIWARNVGGAGFTFNEDGSAKPRCVSAGPIPRADSDFPLNVSCCKGSSCAEQGSVYSETSTNISIYDGVTYHPINDLAEKHIAGKAQHKRSEGKAGALRVVISRENGRYAENKSKSGMFNSCDEVLGTWFNPLTGQKEPPMLEMDNNIFDISRQYACKDDFKAKASVKKPDPINDAHWVKGKDGICECRYTVDQVLYDGGIGQHHCLPNSLSMIPGAPGVAKCQDMSVTQWTQFIRGDANDDGLVSAKDIVAIEAYLKGEGQSSCLDALDVNDDGLISKQDSRQLKNWLKNQSYNIPLPGTLKAGDDPTDDALNCETSNNSIAPFERWQALVSPNDANSKSIELPTLNEKAGDLSSLREAAGLTQ